MALSLLALPSLARRSRGGVQEGRDVLSQDQSIGICRSLVEKVTNATLRCFDLSNDPISIFKSVLLLISRIAGSSAFWRKFAHSNKGGSLMIFPSISLTESSPSTLRSSSNEMRIFPTDPSLFAHPYSLME